MKKKSKMHEKESDADCCCIYQKILDETSSAIYVCDADTYELIYYNKSLSDVFRIKNIDNYKGKTCYEYLMNRTEPCTFCQMKEMKFDKVLERVYDDEERDYHYTLCGQLTEWNGRKVHVEYVKDETERIRSENELQECFKIATRQTGMNVWIYDMQSHIVRSKRTKTYGYKTNCFNNIPESMIEAGKVHPDDIEKFRDLHRLMFGGRKRVEDILRLRWTTKEDYSYIQVAYTVLFDNKGKPVKAVGTSMDVGKKMIAKENYADWQKKMTICLPGTIAIFKMNLTQNRFQKIPYMNCKMRRKSDEWWKYTYIMEDGKVDEYFDKDISYGSEFNEVYDFNKTFNISNLITQFAKGNYQLDSEHRYRFGSKIIWLQTTIHMIQNPETQDVEAVLYLRDIDVIKTTEFLLHDVINYTYECAVLIDVTTQKAKLLGNENKPKKEARRLCYIDNIDDWMNEYIGSNYLGDDKQIVLEEIKLETVLRHLQEDNSYSITYSVNENGKTKRKHLIMRYLEEDSCKLYYVWQDITEIYEEEQRNSRVVERALEIAQKANQAKSEFLLNMTHEIRTPLYGINGMLDLAMSDNLFKTRECVKKAKISADQLTDILNKVLDMSIVEKGNAIIQMQPLILKNFIREIATILEPMAKEKNIQVIFEVINPKLSVIMADPTRLKQLFLNLMMNSIQYGYEGGYAKCQITSEMTGPDEVSAKLVFSDNGHGIPASNKQSVFQEFVNGDEVNKGCGLGLPIVKSIVDNAGGTLHMESNPGMGTRITIELTVVGANIVQEDTTKQLEHMLRKIDQLDFTKFRALVVESNEIDTEVTTIKLQKIGILVETASSGEEALLKLKNSPYNYFDIVFMDVQLPIKNGLEVTKELRQMKRKDISDITIIALTAHPFRDERIRTLEAGMDYHIPLPLDDQELKEILIKELFNLTPKKEYEVRGFRIVK